MLIGGDHPGSILVLTNSRSRGALAAVRSLGRRGWWVGVGSPDGDGLAARSRWTRARHVVARPRGEGQAFVADAERHVRAVGYDLVVGSADDWAGAVSTFADRIPTEIAHPPAAVFGRAVDKLWLARVADRHGLTTPRTVPATDASLAAWEGPVVVKCRTHWAVGHDEALRIEAARHDDADAARPAVAQIEAAGLEAVLQAPVEGVLTALVGVFDGTRLQARVQQRAPLTWPTPYGVSARAETRPVDEDLAARVESLLAEVGWRGLVELQFLDRPGAPPSLIDLNGRYFGSMALAIGAGVDVADASARLALGRPLPPLDDGRTGVRYSWAAGDLRRALQERRGGLVPDVLDSILWLVRADTTSVWSLRDLGPTLWLVTERLPRTGAP